MAFQKRLVVLVKGRIKYELEMGQGHVWEKNGGIGHPIYNAREEVLVFEKLLRKWKRLGFRVSEDTGLVKARAPKKPTDMDAKTWRWVGEADQILQMWRDDEYDNLKDAIEDARSMLLKPPAGQNARTKKLESMLAKAQRQLLRLTVDEPSMAEYANGLLGAPRRVPKKRATTSKKRSSSTRKTIGPRPRSRPR